MAASNWSAEDPVKNYGRQQERAARQAQAKQQERAAQTAGRGRRRI